MGFLKERPEVKNSKRLSRSIVLWLTGKFSFLLSLRRLWRSKVLFCRREELLDLYPVGTVVWMQPVWSPQGRANKRRYKSFQWFKYTCLLRKDNARRRCTYSWILGQYSGMFLHHEDAWHKVCCNPCTCQKPNVCHKRQRVFCGKRPTKPTFYSLVTDQNLEPSWTCMTVLKGWHSSVKWHVQLNEVRWSLQRVRVLFDDQGHCFVKRLNKTLKSTPAILEKVFEMYPRGAPCHSTLFEKHVDISRQPRQTMYEKCKVRCKAGGQLCFQLFTFGNRSPTMAMGDPVVKFAKSVKIFENQLLTMNHYLDSIESLHRVSSRCCSKK